jgi:hypothetical protein
MGVSIDQPWHEHFAVAIHHFGSSIGRFNFFCWTYSQDTIALDRDCTGFKTGQLIIHGQDNSVG